MKPLIKWAGGKSTEIKFIKDQIPSFDRYFEPFFGGGALFFHLKPRTAIINDKCKELMLFYRYLVDERYRANFERELMDYVTYWERINLYMEKFGNSFVSIYNDYKYDKIEKNIFELKIKELFEKEMASFNGLFLENFCINRKNLLNSIEKNVISKLNRIKYKIDLDNKFSDSMLKTNIETAFRSGFYIHFRDIMNQSKKGNINISETKNIANYYFVREFCYGSMFRFNKEGDFNIPYGGIDYNKKDFRKKVETLFSTKTRQLIGKAIIESADFEEVLNRYIPQENDFVFLDPPYDTEFSEYEENPFDKEDQSRLARCVFNLNSKFILIIKETPYILSLYDTKEFREKNIRIESFGKKYRYNVRGRNLRDVRHLIIHNLEDIQFKLED